MDWMKCINAAYPFNGLNRVIMKIFSLIILILIFARTSAQTNLELKSQLDSIMILDQKYRRALTFIYQDSISKDSVARSLDQSFTDIESYVWDQQSVLDSLNLNFIEKVIENFGYPGISMVGNEASEVTWHVIQHSDKISKYIELIKQAGKLKELAPNLIAKMTDRYLMQNNKNQIYGTQGMCRTVKDGTRKCFIWPIENPKKVNKLRAKAGFETTVEENAERLNIEYEVLTLEEIKQY
jgi:hypothetical protein